MGNKGIRDMGITKAESVLKSTRLERGLLGFCVGSSTYVVTSYLGLIASSLYSNPSLARNFAHSTAVGGLVLIATILGVGYHAFKGRSINDAVTNILEAEKYIKEHKDVPTTEGLEAMIDINGVQK
jgi:hypothetical protein